jgi:hypothetical protein
VYMLTMTAGESRTEWFGPDNLAAVAGRSPGKEESDDRQHQRPSRQP